jgi:hypothetical protein
MAFRARALASRFRVPVAITLWLLGTLPFLTRLTLGRTSYSLEHYLATASAALDGARIYADVPFEYPPYALALFIGPASLARTRRVQVLWVADPVIDAGVKAGLLWTAVRERDGPPDFVPFFILTRATAAWSHPAAALHVIPAALSHAALFALFRGWTASAGGRALSRLERRSIRPCCCW